MAESVFTRQICNTLGRLVYTLYLIRCDQDRDGKISYMEFTKYLTGRQSFHDPYHCTLVLSSGQNEAEVSSEDMTTTNVRTYSRPQEPGEESGRDNEEMESQSEKASILHCHR